MSVPLQSTTISAPSHAQYPPALVAPLDPTGLVVYQRTYARRIDPSDAKNRSETFQECLARVTRAVNSQLHCGFTHEECDELFDKMFNLKLSVAGRMLWQLETSTVDSLGLMSLQNCSFTVIDNPMECWVWVMNFLMLGAGVGYRILPEDMEKLPIVKRATVTRLDKPDADFIIPDSRQGWLKLLEQVLTAHFVTGKDLTYSPMLLRSKGAPIKGFGGVASGPDTLCEGMSKISEIFNSRAGQRLRPIDALDILNTIGWIVVSGNVRRCLPEGALVHTADGLKPIKNVKVGDSVRTLDGFHPVTAVFDQDVQELVTVVTESGILECTDNHRVAILDEGKGAELKWIEAGKLTTDHHMVFSVAEDTQAVPDRFEIHAVVKGHSNSVSNSGDRTEFTNAGEIAKRLHISTHQLSKWLGDRLGVTSSVTEDAICLNKAHAAAHIEALVMELVGTKVFTELGKFFAGELTVIDPRYMAFVTTFVQPCQELDFDRLRDETGVPDFVLRAGKSCRQAFLAELVDKTVPLRSDRYVSSIRALASTVGQLLTVAQTQSGVGNFTMCKPDSAELAKGFRRAHVLQVLTRRKIEQTYDIEVKDAHMFFCDGFLVHNSAQIALGSALDLDYMKAKRWDLGMLPQTRAFSNNSIICNHISEVLEGEAAELFWQGYLGNGEPYGLINLRNHRRYGRTGDTRFPDPLVDGVNPCSEQSLENGETCVTGDTLIHCRHGVFPIRDLVGKMVEIWNGQEWSEVEPFLVKESDSFTRVTFSDGSILDVTAGHEFAVLDFKHEEGYNPEELPFDKAYAEQCLTTKIAEPWSNPPRVGRVGMVKCKTTDLQLGMCLPTPEPLALKGELSTDSNLDVPPNAQESFQPDWFKLGRGDVSRLIDNWSETRGKCETHCIAEGLFIDHYELYGSETEVRNLQILARRAFAGQTAIRKRQTAYVGQVLNPCEGDWVLYITEGDNVHYPTQRVVRIEKLEGEQPSYCFSESKLGMGVFNNVLTHQCCLGELFLPNMTSQEEFFQCARYSYRICKHSLALKCAESERTENIVHRNMRMGIGVTGYMQATEEQKSWLSPCYEMLRLYDAEYSARHGFPISKKLTTVKPSGTLSLMAGVTSGIHPAYARWYIRRIRMPSESHLVPELVERGIHIEPAIRFDGTHDHTTLVAEFPYTVPAHTILAEDCSAVVQLNVVKRIQQEWSDNSVSVTVTYKPEELPEIKEWLRENYDEYIKSVSFLRYSGHGFLQAPIEPITEERYKQMMARIKPAKALMDNSDPHRRRLYDLDDEPPTALPDEISQPLRSDSTAPTGSNDDTAQVGAEVTEDAGDDETNSLECAGGVCPVR